MTGAQTLLARCALACVAGAATLVTSRLEAARPEGRLSAGSFDRWFLACFSASRLAVFTLLFLVLRIQVRGDVVGYYFWQTALRVRGAVPYRDFHSSYAPLFQDLLGIAYRLHPAPVSLIFLSVLAEIGAVVLWLSVARRLFRDRVVRLAAVAYLCSSLSLQFVTIDGQNNAFIELLLGAAMLLLLHHRQALSGVVYGLCLATVKFLPLLWFPAFALLIRRRLSWVLGAALVIVSVYGYFMAVLHAPVLQPVSDEGGLKGAGNLPFLIEAVSGRDFGYRLWDVLLLTILTLLVVRVFFQFHRYSSNPTARLRALLYHLPLILFALVAFSKKSWPAYTVMVLFPVVLVLAAAAEHAAFRSALNKQSRLHLLVFGIFQCVALTEHSFWASLLGQAGALSLYARWRTGEALPIAFLVLETCLLVGYGYLAALCWIAPCVCSPHPAEFDAANELC